MNPDKKKVLIIDDEIEMAELETLRLKASGYDVKTATDGESGLRAAREWKPDLVILDIMLPRMDGYQVCAALKRDASCERIPIILVSAVDHKYDTDLGKKVGADFYFTKPFEPAVLLEKIRELLRKKNPSSS
jgi:DNA-binding response OmpR family regulator